MIVEGREKRAPGSPHDILLKRVWVFNACSLDDALLVVFSFIDWKGSQTRIIIS
jgi:hypothetical protein